MKNWKKIYGLMAIISLSLLSSGCWSGGSNRRLSHDDSGFLQSREVAMFNRVALDGDFTVYLQNGPVCSVSLEGDEDVLNLILTEVEDNTLQIGYMDKQFDDMPSSVTVYIKAPDLLDINGEKSIKLITTDIFSFKKLNLNLSGVVDLDMDLSGGSLFCYLSGASNVVLAGKADTLEIKMPGAGKIKAFDLSAKTVNLDFSGAGKAEVSVSDELKVDVSGACHISYKGSPSSIYSNISGIGRLKKVD